MCKHNLILLLFLVLLIDLVRQQLSMSSMKLSRARCALLLTGLRLMCWKSLSLESMTIKMVLAVLILGRISDSRCQALWFFVC
jgi:hypothetical protein